MSPSKRAPFPAYLPPKDKEGPSYNDSSRYEDLQDQGSVQDGVPHAPRRPPQGISVHRLHPQAAEKKGKRPFEIAKVTWEPGLGATHL